MFLCVSLLVFCHLVFAESQNPTQSLQSFLETLRGMDFPGEESAKHDAQVQKAHAAMDLEAMGKKALGAHWAEAQPEQQKEFMALLWKFIENIAYPRSKEFLGNRPIDYGAPKALREGLEIQTTVKNQDEALNASIVYNLYDQEGNWKIYDIFLDGVSITEDLKFQFDKIIQESGFPGLLNRMRERLAKAEQENQKK